MKSFPTVSFGVLLSWLTASTAFAAPPIPAPCLTPMSQGEPDPDVRNVSLNVSSNKQYVTVDACVVSDKDRLAQLGVSFGLFDSNGNFIAVSGQALGEVDPVTPPDPSHPKLISLSTTSIAIDPAYAALLSTDTLVTLQWAPCQSATGACVSGSVTSTPFLRPARLDHATDQ